MASRRVYGRCDIASLLHNQGLPPESIKALLSHSASTISNRLNGSRSVLNFDDISGGTSEKFSDEIDGDHTEIDHDQFSYRPEKKRRLTDDQVEYLEKSFQSETRLEPDRKIQLAKELGLQPRQVAVWFQNRRARCRMKQLEKDFDTLKYSYKTLQIDYDNLLKEKEKLKSEVLRLTEKLLQKKNNAQAPVMDVKKSYIEKEKQSSTSDGEQISPKQEEQSMTVFHYNDAEIAAMVDSDYSSSAFEADHSDLSHELSHLDEDEEIKGYPYVEGNLFGYEFPGEEEHDLWLWH